MCTIKLSNKIDHSLVSSEPDFAKDLIEKNIKNCQLKDQATQKPQEDDTAERCVSYLVKYQFNQDM